MTIPLCLIVLWIVVAYFGYLFDCESLESDWRVWALWPLVILLGAILGLYCLVLIPIQCINKNK